jgi:hypothetical protein
MKRVVLALSLVGLAACSVSPDPNSATLVSRLGELDKQVKDLQKQVKSLQTTIDDERTDRGAAIAEVKDLINSESMRALGAEGQLETELNAAIGTATQQVRTELTTAVDAEKIRALGAESAIANNVTGMTTRTTDLERKTASMIATQVDGQPSVVFSGVNLYVQSGAGGTNSTPNGVGNLIVGYNERPGSGVVRTGSHNLVVGRDHSFGSYGGVVFGLGNSISGKYATVLGGNGLSSTTDDSAVTPNDSAYSSRLNAIEAKNLDTRLTTLESQNLDSRLTTLSAAVSGAGGLSIRVTALEAQNLNARITTLDTTVTGTGGLVSRVTALEGADFETRVAAVETKTASMSAATIDNAASVVFSGVNVYVQSGSGSTSGELNGLGNLIIGYNETRPDVSAVNDRGGSHNLILGQQNNFGSYGGLIAGTNNSSSASYASVLGGDDNKASKSGAVVVAGKSNTASGFNAVVVAGSGNTASGFNAAVVSGAGNSASNDAAAVGGGSNNVASGKQSTVGGGQNKTASTLDGWNAG